MNQDLINTRIELEAILTKHVSNRITCFSDLNSSQQDKLVPLYLKGLKHEKLDDLCDSLTDRFGSFVRHMLPQIGRCACGSDYDKGFLLYQIRKYLMEEVEDFIDEEFEKVIDQRLTQIEEYEYNKGRCPIASMFDEGGVLCQQDR